MSGSDASSIRQPLFDEDDDVADDVADDEHAAHASALMGAVTTRRKRPKLGPSPKKLRELAKARAAASSARPPFWRQPSSWPLMLLVLLIAAAAAFPVSSDAHSRCLRAGGCPASYLHASTRPNHNRSATPFDPSLTDVVSLHYATARRHLLGVVRERVGPVTECTLIELSLSASSRAPSESKHSSGKKPSSHAALCGEPDHTPHTPWWNFMRLCG